MHPESGELNINTSSPAGYMLQKDHLFEWLSIFDNACLGLKIRKQLNPESIEYVNTLFEKYGLDGKSVAEKIENALNNL